MSYGATGRRVDLAAERFKLPISRKLWSYDLSVVVVVVDLERLCLLVYCVRLLLGRGVELKECGVAFVAVVVHGIFV